MITYYRLIVVLVIPLFYLALSHYLLPEYVLPLALFLTIITYWFTEVLPLPVTGLLVPCSIALLGILPVDQAFMAFGNQIIFLFIGSFILARAMQKHKWDERICLVLISSPLGSYSLRSLVILVAIICFVLSMWMSNTAVCAFMTPLCLGIISTLSPKLNSDTERRFLSTHLLLACAYSSSIGGIATPVGSPPNLIAIEFLKNQDVYLTFFDWLVFALPVATTMLIAAIILLQLIFPLPKVDLSELKNSLLHRISSLGRIKIAEIQVLLVFMLAVILWLAPGIFQQLVNDPELTKLIQDRLSIGSVAIFAAALLFILPAKYSGKWTPNMEWQDVATIDWGTILLFGGGLCLGNMLDQTGLAQTLGSLAFSSITSGLLVLIILVGIAILMSEFSSNTASAAILVPIAAGLMLDSQYSSFVMIIGATLGASFGFMLPVSTPPNAIVYGTGKVPLNEMVKAGLAFDLCGLAIIVFFAVYWF